MITLYNGNETTFTHNGLGALSKCISAISSRELNGQWTLTIVHPLDGNYNLVQAGQIIKAPTPSGHQLFRIYKVDEDLNKVTIRCNHIFYDLSQRLIKSSYNAVGSAGFVTQELLNPAYSTGTNLFDVEWDTSVGKTYQRVIGTDLVSALMGSDGSVIDLFGCELDFDNFNIWVSDTIGEDNGVLISYRKNLTGLNETLDYSSLATRLLPVSADGISLPLTNPYIDSTKINDYPIIYTKQLDCMDIRKTDDITYEDLYNALQDACISQFANGVDVPYFVYKVNFIQLSKTEEYKDYAVLEDVNIGDSVKVKHEKLNKDLSGRVHAYSYDCILEKMNSVELGNITRRASKSANQLAKRQLTFQRQNESEILKKYSEIQMLNQALGNYHTEINGVGIIHNASTLATSTNAIRLGDNGVVQKSTDGGSTWVDVGNGNLAIQGDFTCNNIRVNKDMYMYSGVYNDTLIVDMYGTGAEDVLLKMGLVNQGQYMEFDYQGNRAFFTENVYVTGSCSAQSFIDRTPFYDDDALTELSKIKGTKDGEIDHTTLPSFAQVSLEDGTIERDIGNMVSIITKAIQQIIRKFKKVETKLATSGKEVLVLSERISRIEMMLSATDESEDK